MSTIIIVSIIVIFFVCLIVWDENKQEKQSNKVLQDAIAKYGTVIGEEHKSTRGTTIPQLMEHTIEDIEKVLRATGANIEQSGQIDENTYRWEVCFAGGYFLVDYETHAPIARLYYYHFFDFDMADEDIVLRSMAAMNAKYMVWSCYPHYSETEGSQEKVGNVCLSQLLFLNGTHESIVNEIRSIFNTAFKINRDFHEYYEKLKEANHTWALSDTHIDFQNKVSLHVAQQESKYTHTKNEENENEIALDFTIQSLLALYRPKQDWGMATALRIIRGNKVEEITHLPDIMQFNIKHFLQEHFAEDNMQNIILVVDFPHNTFTVHLHQLECDENKMVYMCNLTDNGINTLSLDIFPEHHARKMVISICTDGKEEDDWEAKYMIAEAIDKNSQSRGNELTDEQRMLIAYKDMPESLQMRHYWAQKYYNANYTYQALAYFLAMQKQMVSSINNWWENGNDLFYEVYFHIGRIYLDMGDAERAFYYLNVARDSRRSYFMKEFVNCLCSLRDPFAINYIRSTRDEVVEQINKQDEPNEDLFRFYCFLNRRLVYMLIETGDLENAEKVLQQLIEQDMDVEYAQKELEYLQQKKEQKNHNQ